MFSSQQVRSQEAVRDAVTLVSPAADAHLLSVEVSTVMRSLSQAVSPAGRTPFRAPWEPTPLTDLHAGPRALLKAVNPSATGVLLLLDLAKIDELVAADPTRAMLYLGFRAVLWASPFLSGTPDSLQRAYAAALQPPLVDRTRLCPRAVGNAVPLLFLRALYNVLGPMTLARSWSEQLEDHFLRSLPRLLAVGSHGPSADVLEARLLAARLQSTPLARFFPARVVRDQIWKRHHDLLRGRVAGAPDPLLRLRDASAAADRCVCGASKEFDSRRCSVLDWQFS